MADKIAQYIIGFDGDDGGLRSMFSALKTRVRSDVAELEAITKKADLFAGLEDKVKLAADAFFKATQRASELRQQIAEVNAGGGKVGDELARTMATAEKAVASASREYTKQSDLLSKIGGQLSAAGVDTKNLAAEQARLADALKAAAAAAQDQTNKQTLGIKSFRDTQVEANRLIAAYNALRDSGKLSFGELSIAQAKLQQSLSDLRAQSIGVGAAFSEIRGSVLAFAAAFAGIGVAISESAANYRAFAQQVAAVDSIAGVSKAQLAELENGVRSLARQLGVDAVQSTKALYDILSSGIPPQNALTVLEEATKASIAGITDVATAARVGVAVVNAYGLEISSLQHVYDVLFQTVKDGVVTFPELANSIGEVLPVARSARVSLEEVGAAFVVLTQRGINANEAATSIARAIKDLSAPAPEAAERFRSLGISLDGFVGTIEQIADKKLSLSVLTDIIPDVRAQRAVLTLADNISQVRTEIVTMVNAAETMQAAYAKMAATPQANLDRFNASIKDLSLSLGEFVSGTGGFVQKLTGILNGFNDLDSKTKNSILTFAAVTAGLTALTVVVTVLAGPINLLVGALASLGTAATSIASGGFTAAALAVAALQVAIVAFLSFKLGEKLYEAFAPVRLIGDLIGLSAAAIDNLATFVFARLKAALTGNSEAAAAATAAFNRNRQIIAEDWSNAISGGTEKSRQMTKAQEELEAQFGRATTAALKAAQSLDADLAKALGTVKGQIDAADASITKIQQRLSQLVAGLQESVTQTQQAAQQALASVNANEQQQLAALTNAQDTLSKSQRAEIDNLRDTVAIQSKAAADRLAILQKFAIDVKAAFDKEAEARLAVAKESGENIKKVEQELALKRVAILQTVVDAFRAHVNQLETEYKSHIEKIKTLEDQRLAIVDGINGKIREIERQRLTVGEQYADRIKEIDENVSKARQALLNGDLKSAEEYARKVITLSDSIGTEVKDDQGIIVDAYTAQSTQIGVLRTGQDLLLQITNRRIEAEKNGAEASRTALDAAVRQLGELSAQLKNAQDAAAAGIKVQITTNIAEVKQQIEALAQAIESREHLLKIRADLEQARAAVKQLESDIEKGVTLNVTARTDQVEAKLREVQALAPSIDLNVTPALAAVQSVRNALSELGNIKATIEVTVSGGASPVTRAAGGFIGMPPAAFRASVFARGGAVSSPVQRYATGGTVFRLPNYDKVPGSGDGDTVPARLKLGSFVMRKSASQYYGDGIMSMLARGYASGGPVGYADGGLTKPLPFGFPSLNLSTASSVAEFQNLLRGIIETFSTGLTASQPGLPILQLIEQLRALFGRITGFAAGGPVGFDGGGAVHYHGPTGYYRAADGRYYQDFGSDDANTLYRQSKEMFDFLFEVLATNVRVPAPHGDLEYVNYLRNVSDLIYGDLRNADMPDAKALYDSINNMRSTIVAGAQQANLFHSALVYEPKYVFSPGQLDASGAFAVTPDSALFTLLSKQVLSRFSGPIARPRRFAAGGDVDTVPAMLTPGEWVISPSGVKNALRMFGGGFLDGLNQIKVPRDFLAGFATPSPPPARFANGGPVGYVPRTGTATSMLGAPLIGELHLHGAPADFLSVDNVRRFVAPALNEIERRAGKRP